MKKMKKVSELNINCRGVKIESKPRVKYLGAVIDYDMSGKTMTTSIIKKVNSGFKFLFRKTGFLKCKKRKCFALLISLVLIMRSMFITKVLKRVSKTSYKQPKIRWLGTF